MKKIFFFTNLLFTLTAVPIFGQVGTPFSVTSTDTSICEGETTTLSVQSIPGTITTLTCVSATNNGTLVAGTAASGVSSSIPYLGGNGGLHNGQTVASTGVTGLTATLTAGTFSTGNGSLIYTITGTPSTNGTASFALNIGGKACTLTRTVAAGTITALTCASATNNGTLTAGVAASGVSTVVPYTGGNGGTHNGQTVMSTGITGLTATLSAGAFAVGVGSVTYTITGTPTSAGTASFALNIGGRTCTLTRTVNCWSLNNTTTVVEVTNPTTGKTWMDRNLGAVRQATSSTDVFGYGDIYQWGRNADGHQCRNSLTVASTSNTDQAPSSNFIVVSSTNPGDWRNPQNNNLWQGVNGINNPCPSGFRVPTYAELNAEAASWTVANAYASVLKLPAGGGRLSVNPNNGNLVSIGVGGVYWTSTISGTNSRNISFGSLDQGLSQVSRSDGMSVRCIKETVGSIGALNCGSATVTGNLVSGTAASGVSVSIPYTGGNGGFYAAQSNSSTGVTGLTATISQGLFASGAGNLVYTISGTSNSASDVSFIVNIGGQTCNLNINILPQLSPTYPANSVFCANGSTEVIDVINPTTGKTWMDRNLGATRVATSSTDAAVYGDLYQWGRRSDGHQCRTSATTSTLSSVDQPANGNFILGPNTPFDWRSPQNTSLWQGVNGTNNPCPSGYRVPTETELNNERLSWVSAPINSTNSSNGAFASPLKLTMVGRRFFNDGSISNLGTDGNYWSSTLISTSSRSLNFTLSNSSTGTNGRAFGLSIRCIKETVGSIGALNCGSATVTGNLISGTAVSGVTASVPYTGGNGGYYAAQSISSTGVTGITASISQGLFSSGTGNLVYSISGTPSADGTASFALNIGGQSCTLSIATLGSYYPAGSVFCASGPTVIKDVTNPTTGKTWMDRNLGATRVATSSTDAAAYGDLYQWGRRSDGHQCRTSTTTTTLSSTDQPVNGNFIIPSSLPYDWRNPQSNTLWQGINGVNNPCPSGYRLPTDTELDSDRLSWTTNNSAGAFASNLKLPITGYRNYSTAALTSVGTNAYYWSSTISSSTTGSNYLVFNSSSGSITSNMRANGISVRCIKETVGSIGALNCGSSTVTGNLVSGTAASGVSVSIPYTGGNGGFYAAQSNSSTGVTGLTATISQGLFASGAGNLVYTISGTSNSASDVSFIVNIGGQTCNLNINILPQLSPTYPANSVFCANGSTEVIDVINPTTGKTWMDRNLGATRVATSSTDAAAYGDLYQWGRRSDGHQCRNSATTSTLSSTDTPAHGNFIVAPNTPFDWRNPQNTNLWQGVNGTNNPCPNGYRLPTQTELDNEQLSWVQAPINSTNDVNGAFASPLKLPAAGSKGNTNGFLFEVGSYGRYWAQTVSDQNAINLYFKSDNAGVAPYFRALGLSVRCIKD